MPEWLTSVSLVLAVALSVFNLWDKIDAKNETIAMLRQQLQMAESGLVQLPQGKSPVIVDLSLHLEYTFRGIFLGYSPLGMLG